MMWRYWAERECAAINELGRWREIQDLDSRGVSGFLDGRRIVSFASNDYLALATHPDVITAAHVALDRWGAGSGSARLIAGSRPVHSELEREIASWKKCESALLFPTGFAANLAVLTTFGTSETLICSDELNHASIIDGCRLAKARVAIYPHKDVATVDRLLADAARSMVVTDTVFSMDGDVAPVDELAEVCARHGALLVLDEAHAVLGPDPSLEGVEHLRVGTLSKYLGALGGFVAGPTALIELMKNRARSFIFTTASTPADSAAALAALRLLRSRQGDALRQRLSELVERVAPGHRSPIIPILLGDESKALSASQELLARGFLVPAIRPPSVPAGTSRLRVTLSAAHSVDEVDALAESLEELVAVTANA